MRYSALYGWNIVPEIPTHTRFREGTSTHGPNVATDRHPYRSPIPHFDTGRRELIEDLLVLPVILLGFKMAPLLTVSVSGSRTSPQNAFGPFPKTFGHRSWALSGSCVLRPTQETWRASSPSGTQGLPDNRKPT